MPAIGACLHSSSAALRLGVVPLPAIGGCSAEVIDFGARRARFRARRGAIGGTGAAPDNRTALNVLAQGAELLRD